MRLVPTPSVPGATWWPTPDEIYASAAVRGIDKLVCLSLRSDASDGKGTPENPFNVGGSGLTADLDKAERLDAILAASFLQIDTGVMLYFVSRGEFCTDIMNRTWQPRPLWIMGGLGRRLTTIKAVTADNSLPNYDHEVIKVAPDTPASGFALERLTLDCNGTALSALAAVVAGEPDISIFGTDLRGSNIVIDDVRCIHQYGSQANGRESFGLAINSPSNAVGFNNEIKNCLVELPVGNYGNPYAMFGSNAYPATDCRVTNSHARGTNDGNRPALDTGGVNCGFLKNFIMRGCDFVDVAGIFYCDTGWLDGVSVSDSSCVRGVRGVSLVANETSDGGTWTKKNIQLFNLRINLQNRITGGGVYAFEIDHAATSNLVGDRNVINYRSDGNGLNQYWHLYFQNVSDSSFTNTIADQTGNGLNGNPSNFTLRFNRAPNGQSLYAVNGTSLADTTTNVNEKQTSLVGSRRITGTKTNENGYFGYYFPAAYTIAAGDRLEYEVFLDEANPTFAPYLGFHASDLDYSETTDIVDQNGVISAHAGDIEVYARGKWYFRSFLLTAHAGVVTAYIRIGEEPLAGSVGTHKAYYRNVKVVGADGITKVAYYTDEVRIDTDHIAVASAATGVTLTDRFRIPDPNFFPPTADPHINGALWNDAGTPTISSG